MSGALDPFQKAKSPSLRNIDKAMAGMLPEVEEATRRTLMISNGCPDKTRAIPAAVPPINSLKSISGIFME